MNTSSEEIYFASDFIEGIDFDIIVSNNGIREILINKKSNKEHLNKAIKVSSNNAKVLRCLQTTERIF